MANKAGTEASIRTLTDLRDDHSPMGGISQWRSRETSGKYYQLYWGVQKAMRLMLAIKNHICGLMFKF